MQNIINYVKENKEKIAYSYPYLVFFTLLCFIGWACNSLYVSYLSISLFIIITPLLNKDMRLILLPALLSFTGYRTLLEFENIPIPIIITVISLFISTFIYFLRNFREKDFKIKTNILTRSLLIIGLLMLLSTIIRHIFFNEYALIDYVSETKNYYKHVVITWSKYSYFYKIGYGYLISLGVLFLGALSIMFTSSKRIEEPIYLKIIYVFSVYLIVEVIIALMIGSDTGWGEKNLIAIALEVTIAPLIYLYSKNYKRVDYLLLALLSFLLIVILHSRGALLALIIISPYLMYIIIKNNKYKWRIIIITYSALLLLSIISIIALPSIRNKVIDVLKGNVDIHGRNVYWEWITDYVKSNPAHMIFGGSPVFLFEIYPGFHYIFMEETENIPFMLLLCHSTIMTTLAMGGILGLLSLLFHRIEVFKGIIKANDEYKHMLICFILIGIIHGLTDNTFFSVIYFIPYMMILSDYEHKNIDALSDKENNCEGVN